MDIHREMNYINRTLFIFLNETRFRCPLRRRVEMQKEVIVASSVRTAIGDFGGALAAVSPTELGATVIREVLSRAHVDGEEVGHGVFGNVIHTEPKDMYLAPSAALEGSAVRS